MAGPTSKASKEQIDARLEQDECLVKVGRKFRAASDPVRSQNAYF
jgi:hypothetical protein